MLLMLFSSISLLQASSNLGCLHSHSLHGSCLFKDFIKLPCEHHLKDQEQFKEPPLCERGPWSGHGWLTRCAGQSIFTSAWMWRKMREVVAVKNAANSIASRTVASTKSSLRAGMGVAKSSFRRGSSLACSAVSCCI